ncbi:hypothetical protein BDZ45DRAFT_578322 [Acephala macrosclerotiorum]|nr:hypothetical protein BDZ45DRAFT_578322 [Acephala macrosclerotiorum]
MFKFVASDGIGNSHKRHQARRACENCRRRKKACHHGQGPLSKSKTVQDENRTTAQGSASPSHSSYANINDQLADRPQAKDVTQECTPTETESHRGGNSMITSNEEIQNPRTLLQAEQSHQTLHRQEDQNSRFIGDLSPEGIFLSATSPGATRGGSVGVWLTTNSNKTTSQTTNLQSPSNLFYGTGPLIQQVLVPILEQECLSALPPPPRLSALTEIYFDKVYPILPVVDEADYRDLPPTDPHRVLLQQGICLAASKNFAARQHLVLDESASPLNCREFGEKLSGAMRMSIEMGLVTIKIVIIRALMLMHQFTDNPIGEDFTSQFCTRAVHHAQSIGMHLKEDQDRSSSTLFCCVWAIDKLNAALYGRAVQMHERDLSVDLPSYFDAQEPSFRLFLHVIALLEKVIDIYRPASSENPVLTWDFPSFEDVALRCGVSQISTSALGEFSSPHLSMDYQNYTSITGNIPNQSMQDVDLSVFGSIPDIDLFGMFDPAFDLDGFDACLEGNLNPAFPTNFQ